MIVQRHQRSTGADFQVKKIGGGARPSKATSEKKAKGEELVHYGRGRDIYLLLKECMMS